MPHMVVPTTMGKKPPLKFVPFHKYLSEIEDPRPKKSEKTDEEILTEIEEVIRYNRSKKKGGEE